MRISGIKTIKSIIIVFILLFLISIKLSPLTQKSTTKMSNPINTTTTTINPYERLHIIPNPNGTITRLPEYYPTIKPSVTNPSSPSISKEVVLNPDKNTSLRIYLPRNKLDTISKERLPIIVFVHGGGFVLCSVGTPVVHHFCCNAATQLNALIVSVEYRLAPEHRLPAAYDDVFDAFTWVKQGKDEWVNKYGNFSNCVVMGESAGGNIVYHAGLKLAAEIHNFRPLVISGLVLIQPYFGGVYRSGSEIRLVNALALPLVASDLMWDLSLPIGANRNHEYCDPLLGGGSSLLGRVRDLGWRIGVLACDGDPLFDRNIEFVKLLESRGVCVRSMIQKGGSHGMFVNDITKINELFDFVRQILS